MGGPPDNCYLPKGWYNERTDTAHRGGGAGKISRAEAEVAEDRLANKNRKSGRALVCV